jgi:hypothetical protein
MAITRNITIEQGTTVSIAFTALDAVGGNRISLVGKTINAEMKRMFNAYTAYEFEVVVTETEDPETFGDFTINMTADYSSQIEGGRYVYDIEINDAGTITRIYEGLSVCKPQVSTANPYSNVQGIKQFAPNTVHKHDNLQALDGVKDWTLATDTYIEAQHGDKWIVDCTDGSVTIKVPENPPIGFTVDIMDAGLTFSINPLLVTADDIVFYPQSDDGMWITAIYTPLVGYRAFNLGGLVL